MSDLRPRGVTVNIEGVERHLLFTVNAINAVQDQFQKSVYDVLDDIVSVKVPGNTIRDVLMILINDDVEREHYRNPECTLEPVTEHEVGMLIGMDNYPDIVKAVLGACGISVPEGEDDPNRESGQMIS